jgi:Na+-transporting NADH:ubiquinone oxidoreductase subunit C
MKDKLLMIIFVLVLGSVLTAALVVVNNVTTPIIDTYNVQRIKMSVLDVLGIPYDAENLESVFFENVDEKLKGAETFYVSKNGDIAFEISGAGLWGPIEGVMGLKNDRKTIKRIVIVRQEETPGLGGRIGEDEFLNRFLDKAVVPTLEIVAPGKAQSNNQVDGITGATMSVKALEILLNTEVQRYLTLLSEEDGQ